MSGGAKNELESIVNELVLPAGVPTPLGDILFSQDGNTVFFLGGSEGFGSAVWSAPVNRDGTGNVTSFGTATFTFTSPFMTSSLEVEPNSSTLFFRRSQGVGERRTDGMIFEFNVPGISFTGGLAFVPPPLPNAGDLLIGVWSSGDIFTHTLTDNGNGTFTPVSDGLFSTSEAGATGDMHYICSGAFANDLMFVNWNSGTVGIIDIDDMTGLPVGGSMSPSITTFASGLGVGPWGLEFDPVTGNLFISNFGGIPSNGIVQVSGFAPCAAVAGADLSLAKSDSDDPVISGNNLVYTLKVDNNGGTAAQDVVVNDVLPAGVTLVSTSGCAEDPVGVPNCTLGTVPAGGSAQYTITVTVNAPSGSLINNASVSSSTAEANPGDEDAMEVTQLAPGGVAAGLAAWFKADAGVVADGMGLVSLWRDSSSNGRNATQADPNRQPEELPGILNGNPTLRFESDSMPFDGTFLANSNYTVFAVEGRDRFGVANFFLGGSTAGVNQNLILGYENESLLRQAHFGNDLDAVVPAYTGTQDFALSTFRFDMSEGRTIYRFGQPAASDSSTAALSSNTGAALGAFPALGFARPVSSGRGVDIHPYGHQQRRRLRDGGHHHRYAARRRHLCFRLRTGVHRGGRDGDLFGRNACCGGQLHG